MPRFRHLALFLAGIVACDNENVQEPHTSAVEVPVITPVPAGAREVVVIGTVRDYHRGTPIPFADATLGGRIVQGDADGRFVFIERVAPSEPVLKGSLRVRAIGYTPAQRELLIAVRDTVWLDIELREDRSPLIRSEFFLQGSR